VKRTREIGDRQSIAFTGNPAYAWEIVGGFLLSSVTIVVIDELHGAGGGMGEWCTEMRTP
jgi:hypothetical protein